jgi:hypothetical protein
VRFRALIVALATAAVTIAVAPLPVAPPHAASPTPRPVAARATTAIVSSPTPPGFVVGIAIFPDGTTALKTPSGPDPYTALATELNKPGRPFHAWIVDDPKCKPDTCRLSDARIYVYGKQTKANGTDTPASLTLTSFFANAPTVERINSIPLAITSTSTGDTVRNLGDDDVRALVGHLVLDDQFKVAISLPDTENALQLVPSPVNATDPDFEPILEHILGTFGVAAVRSRLAASSIRGPSDAATCPGAQRYFIYRVRLEEYPNKLIGRTRVSSYAEGFILDCTTPGRVPSATGRNDLRIPTTSALLTDLEALAIALGPKLASRNLTLSTNAFSKLVDRDPRSTDVRDTVASLSLSQLVENMCIRLLQQQPNATASAPPSPAATANALPWFTSRAQAEPLQCKARIPYSVPVRTANGVEPQKATFELLQSLWKGEPQPPKP